MINSRKVNRKISNSKCRVLLMNVDDSNECSELAVVARSPSSVAATAVRSAISDVRNPSGRR